VHPILADRRALAAYAAAALPVAATIAVLLTRGPNGFPARPAIALALPFALAALALLLPVWYVCRALPPRETTVARLLVTHGVCALAFGLSWTYLGAALVRAIAPFAGPAGLDAVYALHAPGLLAGGALLYLAAAFLHYLLLAVEATRRAEQQSLKLAVLAREAELKALKAQVHPHFLFNSLNSISSLTARDPARAREMCILLADFFRTSLALGERPSVPLSEELAVARNYLAIEALRLGARLKVAEEVDEAALACRLPPLLLQPLVENAVRHGIATCTEGGLLHLEARSDGQTLRVRLQNPYDPESPSRPGVGLGLSSARKRLAACYGERAGLDAERAADRFTVRLHLPALRGD
jgi:hypothetical protein